MTIKFRFCLYSKVVKISLIFLLVACNETFSDSSISENYEDSTLETPKDEFEKLGLRSIENLHKLNGLWTYVKSKDNFTDDGELFLNECDLYFENDSEYDLEYPCRRVWSENKLSIDQNLLHFENSESNYHHVYKAGFKYDTLVLMRFGVANYYIKTVYEKDVVRDLIKFEYNANCFKGEWSLDSIKDHEHFWYALEDAKFAKLLSKLNVKNDLSSAVYFENDTIYFTKDNAPLFHFCSLERVGIENHWRVTVEPFEKIDGKDHWYIYKLLTDTSCYNY